MLVFLFVICVSRVLYFKIKSVASKGCCRLFCCVWGGQSVCPWTMGMWTGVMKNESDVYAHAADIVYGIACLVKIFRIFRG
jgi:hypothetical protein